MGAERGRTDAKRTLVHYFRVVFDAAGLQWTSDNEGEVEGIIDDVLDASKEV